MSNSFVSTNNTFHKTFTGTDTLAFVIFPESKPILLGSITTISYSIFREKRPVPLLGKINTGGYTRGMRTIAGTFIFTLINQHFVKDIMEQIPYLEAHGKMKADELPFFDVMVVSANEYGANCQMMMYGVEILDDAQVISINDLFIENTFGFVARDIDVFGKKNPLTATYGGVESGAGSIESKSNYSAENIDTVMPYDFNINGYKDFMNSVLKSTESDKIYKAQGKLINLNLLSKANGVLDNDTFNAILQYQKDNQIMETGLLDDVTYQMINGKEENVELISVESKNGAFIYDNINKDNIIGISKYKDNLLGTLDRDMYKVKFSSRTGYISVDDTNMKRKEQYTFEYLTDNFNQKININEFDPSLIGVRITSSSDTEIKMSVISHFKNGSTIVKSKCRKLNVNCEVGCKLSDFPSSYIYNIKEESMPYMIEFIVYPNNFKSIKWIIELLK